MAQRYRYYHISCFKRATLYAQSRTFFIDDIQLFLKKKCCWMTPDILQWTR